MDRQPLFDFGISQEDPRIEYQGLDIQPGDRVLCIASAGDLPITMLAKQNIKITAVDVSMNQLYLSKLKFAAARYLEPAEAAAFLGFLESEPEKRKKWFLQVCNGLDDRDKIFWENNPQAIEYGPVRIARFERYITKFNKIGKMVLGEKKLLKLFEMDNIKLQQDFFDRHLSTSLLKMIFKIAFHPAVYKKRGMASAGLTHSGKTDIASFFYSRFRNFCSSTPARKNHYLQFTFFNKILFPEALPEYLTKGGKARLIENNNRLTFKNLSYSRVLEQCKKGEFNKFHLSNISDWMSKDELAKLFYLIKRKADHSSIIMMRYIHCQPIIPNNLMNYFCLDHGLGRYLEKLDRYPFYNILPMKILQKNK